ncbi:MAG TPA: thiamine phosphate synthase [Acidimicrobiales bacterium]|jgi:thiamine-phosphate pyrophosphorylase
MPPPGHDLASRRLYLCTGDRPDLERFVEACIAGGVDVVQLREKHLEARPLLERAARLLRVCRGLGVPFILNDRPDLALEVGADGVHVGQGDAPPALCRRILGPAAIVGLSTHAPPEWDAAAAEADYLSAGPVSATPTKPGRAGTGLGYLRHAASSAETRPWFVTGGATPDTVAAMAEAGARRFVAVRWLTEASDPRQATRQLRDAIERSVESLLS